MRRERFQSFMRLRKRRILAQSTDRDKPSGGNPGEQDAKRFASSERREPGSTLADKRKTMNT
jgi:hypothetical protein